MIRANRFARIALRVARATKVMNGHVSTTLRYLVEEVRVSTINTIVRGNAPLHVAVIWGRVECVAYLLSKGADQKLRNAGSSTAAEMARLRQSRLVAKLQECVA